MSKNFKRNISLILAGGIISAIIPAQVLAENEEYASEAVKPEVFSNYSRSFFEGNGGFSASKIIYMDDFIKMDIWKNEFSPIDEWENNRVLNTLVFKGLEYELLLTNPKLNNINSGFSAGKSDTQAYTTIDIPDGVYSGVSFLGGSDNASVSKTGIIRFNYADGTKGEWIEYDNPSVTKASENSIEVTAKKIAASGITGDGGSFYLHQVNVLADSSDSDKTMVSIDIASRNAKLENGTLELDTRDYVHWARFLAMSMLIDKAKGEEIKVDEIKKIIDTLPEANEDFVFSNENINKLYDIENIYNTVEQGYITKSEYKDILLSAESYIKLIDYVKILENNAKIEEIDELMKDLPSIEDLTISDKNTELLELLNEKYSDVNISLEINEEYKAVLNRLEDYNKQYKILRTSVNNELISDIKAITDTLPDISEFSKLETYTDEVVEKLHEIKDILDGVDELLEIADKDTLLLAKEYVSKIDVVYEMENEEKLLKISEYMDSLPEVGNMEYSRENERIIVSINKIYAAVHADLLTSEQKTIYNKAKSYIDTLSKFPPVSVTINPDTFANTATAYKSGNQGLVNDGSSNIYFIDGAEFMKMNIWKNAWKINSHYGDNTLIFNDIAYQLRVAVGDYAVNASYCALSGAATGYDVIDINDGLYTGISFLGGTNVNGRSAAAAFNYSDGTSSKFITQSISQVYNESDSAMKVPGGVYSSSGGASFGRSVYLYQYTFTNPNPEKKVVSISIPYRNAIITNGELTCGPVSGGTAYVYWGRWLGMTMLQSYAEFEKVMSDKFNALKDVSDDSLNEKISELDSNISNAESMGIDVSEIDGYEIYLEKGKTLPRIKSFDTASDLESCTAEVEFACDVKITKADITLIDKNGKNTEFDFSYGNNTAKVIFKNDFDYTAEYTLKILGTVSAVAGGKMLGNSAEYKFSIPQAAGFTRFDVEDRDGVAYVSFEFENTQLDETDALIIVCVLDENGSVYDSFAAKKEGIKKGETLKVDSHALNALENYSIKVFCWDNLTRMNTIYRYKK